MPTDEVPGEVYNKPASTVYRLFDRSTLLYIGYTGNVPVRFQQHARRSPWWKEVTSVKFAFYTSQEEAREAERTAILNEKPFYNIHHNRNAIPNYTEEFSYELPETVSTPLKDLKLHIYTYDFTIPSRYVAGHILNEGEAKALDQLMLENIRNNVAPWVRQAEANAGGILPLDLHEALQVRIHDYADAYQFQVRTRTRPISAIEAAIDELASTQAEREGNVQGLAPDSPEVLLRYRQLQLDPTVRSQARQIVAERARLTSDTLAEILGVEDTPDTTPQGVI